MGGAIVAANKMADLSEQMAENAAETRRQATLYSVDQAYWQVVSLSHKKRLAESYLELVRKLDSDVGKMITDGVATRSDALSVSVKVNEAEMALTKVTDGLTLSKMLLCQICGLPVSESEKLIVKSEEGLARLSPSSAAANSSLFTFHSSLINRPELRMLQNTVDISRQATNLMKAGNLPQVMLTGGYAVSNPNTFNGFERKFGGFWNVGVLVRVPVWNWGDVRYKVRASKGLTAVRQLELDETREKIELQVSQSSFRVDEARKRLALAQASIARADENLHTANVGFKEGVITPTTVMEAQTAWLQAQSELVDAQIEVCLSQVDLKKSLGILSE
jgi:outer membrane protein TolC